ncbi:MAG: helix-turn-helix domain-containing protein [Rhodocyclaceae bacterium]|nr:MAG: helix-turn-helix domain-containing protein [Rhodocyclaceae bacterium]
MSKAVFDIKNIPNLHRLERVVLKELALFADKSNRAWPHNKTLADKTGYSVRSVQKALQSLQKIGFIDVKYTGRFIANGDFLVEKRYIDLLVQNWMPKKTDGQAAKDSNIIELSAKDIEARRINIFGRKPSI